MVTRHDSSTYESNLPYLRMHPEIAKWPSYHFYGDKLKNGPQKRTSSFLRPYVLLDSHRIGKETKKGTLICNHGEASFIGR